MSTVKVRLDAGPEVTAAITVVQDLGLADGVAVLVLVKSTEVSIALA